MSRVKNVLRRLVPRLSQRLLRYAVIGAGSAACVHLREIGQQEDVTLVGVSDPAPPGSWRIPSDYATVPRFRDAARLLHDTQPDLVSICTPNRFHCELTLLALRAGAHVVCEKPMAMTLAEAQLMEAERAACGKLGAINFSYRNEASFRFARDLIARGELGRVTRSSVVYLQSFRGVPGTTGSWRSDIEMAGFGALGDLGVHMIDSVRYVTGLEFRRVVGVAQTSLPALVTSDASARPVTTDTNAAFLAELDDSVVATFETTQTAPGYGDFFRLEVSGEFGSLAINSEKPDAIWLRSGGAFARSAIWKTDMTEQKLPTSFAHGAAPTSPGAIVKAIRGVPVTFPTFADGVAAQRVLAAIVGSMETNAWATVA